MNRLYDQIAPEMREARRWIRWRPVLDQDGKINKVPIDPFTDRPFERDSGWQTDPARWTSFEDASASGAPIGFVLGDGWMGADFDDCIIDGKFAPWVAAIVRQLGSYAEVSPSGTGVKVFMHGTRPAGAKESQKCPAWSWEIYGNHRYFAVTGQRLPDAPSTVAERTPQIEEITSIVWGDDLVNLCKLRGIFLREDGPNVHIRCPWTPEHSDSKGGDKDAALQIKDGKVIGFHCFHTHCEQRKLPDVLRRFFDVRRPGDEHIDRLNARYAVLSVGNKMVVAEFDTEQLIELWPFEEFRRKLIKEPTIPIGKGEHRKRIPLADFWLKHPDGRQHDRLVYVMPGSRERLREGDYNGYQDFTVTPAPGDWSKNHDHLFTIICGGDQRIFEWLMNWLAALVQLPGRHAWSAIVLQGDQGVGKGHFADLMIGQCFYPQQYLHLIGANQLTAEFNEHFSGKVFIFGDESTWGGEKQAAERLKGLITEDTVIVHRKFLKAVEEPSALHIIMASNSDWPVAIPKNDRRFLVLDVAQDQRQNQHYFTELRAELANGGRAAMLHDLLRHPINDAALRQPPDTAAKRAVKARSFSAEETFIQNWLMDSDGTWIDRAVKSDLYEAYTRSLPRSVTPRSIEGFGKIFKKCGIEWAECRLTRTNTFDQNVVRPKGYLFPSLAECRAAFDQALGVNTEWPSECPGEEEPGREPGQEDLKEVA